MSQRSFRDIIFTIKADYKLESFLLKVVLKGSRATLLSGTLGQRNQRSESLHRESARKNNDESARSVTKLSHQSKSEIHRLPPLSNHTHTLSNDARYIVFHSILYI